MVAELKTPTLSELSTRIVSLIKEVEQIDRDHEGEMFPADVEKVWKEKRSEIDRLNAEYASYTDRNKALANYADLRERHTDRKAVNIQHGEQGREGRPANVVDLHEKSLGRRFIESAGYKDAREMLGVNVTGDVRTGIRIHSAPDVVEGISAKALLYSDASSAGDLYRPQRLPTILPLLQRPLMIVDLLPTIPVAVNSFEYVKESTFTNNADIVPEASATASGGTKPESALAFTLVQDAVETIAHWIPASRQILADAPQLQAYVDNRLRYGVLRKLEDVSYAALTGASGIQTQAMGADTSMDAIYKAMVKIRVVFGMPNGVIINPSDFQDIRLEKAITAGTYLMGDPSQAGAVTLWGEPIVETQAATAGTALVGDFQQGAALFDRQQIQTYVSDSHSDFFIRNLIAILMELRAKVAVFRGNFLCTVTGI